MRAPQDLSCLAVGGPATKRDWRRVKRKNWPGFGDNVEAGSHPRSSPIARPGPYWPRSTALVRTWTQHSTASALATPAARLTRMERCAASVIQGSAVASRGGAGPDCNVVWFWCIKADDATPCGQALDLAVRRASLSLTAKGLCSLHRGHGSSRREARATVSGLMKVIYKLDKRAPTGVVWWEGGRWDEVYGGTMQRLEQMEIKRMKGDGRPELARLSTVEYRKGQDRQIRPLNNSSGSSSSGVLLSFWRFGLGLFGLVIHAAVEPVHHTQAYPLTRKFSPSSSRLPYPSVCRLDHPH